MIDYFGKEVPKLGFGLMRLPRKDGHMDVEQIKDMVDAFLEAGFTYFDTAYVYEGSEEVARKALVDRHPRNSFTLATKLNTSVAATEEEARRELATSLERTGAGYFDYYLLHAVSWKNWEKYADFRLWDFLAEQKIKGLIRHAGFSFHADPKLLDQLLSEHPEVDFVQLQINYADWENPSVMSRANYEVARKHGKSIVIMEPVKGGNLAKLPLEGEKLMKAYHPEMSLASWAIRFAASLEGIITVLSGMSDMEQMRDNLSFMKRFCPLCEEEQRIIHQVQRILGNSSTIPCTACHYCTKGCPEGIPIPEIFSAMNKWLGNGQMTEAVLNYQKAVKGGGFASACVGCGQCEEVCPQQLGIRKYLEQCAKALEG